MGRNLLSKAASFIQAKMVENASELVTYERPDMGFVELQAIVGRTEYEQNTDDGLVGRIAMRDFTISAASLVINGCSIVPERNDIIVQTMSDGTEYIFRVLGEGEMPHVQDSDGYGVAFRVHTKRDN